MRMIVVVGFSSLEQVWNLVFPDSIVAVAVEKDLPLWEDGNHHHHHHDHHHACHDHHHSCHHCHYSHLPPPHPHPLVIHHLEIQNSSSLATTLNGWLTPGLMWMSMSTVNCCKNCHDSGQ